MNLNLPNWGYLHFAVVDNHQAADDLNIFNRFVKQFKKIEKGIYIFNSNSLIVAESKHAINDDEKLKIDKIISKSKSEDQIRGFLNSRNGKMEFQGNSIMKSLGIKEIEYMPFFFIGVDPAKKQYHPEDLGHFIRQVNISSLLWSLGVLKTESGIDYFTLNYRIRIRTNGKSEFMVNKRSYCEKHRSGIIGTNKHVDYWSIAENSNDSNVFVQFVCPNNSLKGKFVNYIILLYNARMLGFTVTDFLIIQYWFKHGKTEKIVTALKEDINKLFLKMDVDLNVNTISKMLHKLKDKLLKVYIQNIIYSDLSTKEIEKIRKYDPKILIHKLGLYDENGWIGGFILENLERE